MASTTAGFRSSAGELPRGADVDLSAGAKPDQTCGHLAAAGVLDTDEEHLGLQLRDRALRLSERS